MRAVSPADDGGTALALGGMTATRLALLRAIRNGDLRAARRLLTAGPIEELGDPLDALLETIGIYQEQLRLQAEELQLSRARAEAAGQRLQRVFEQLPVPAFLLDRGGAIVDANQAAVSRFELDLHAEHVHLLRQCVEGLSAHRVGEALAEAKLLGHSLLRELPLQLPDGGSGIADLYVTRLEADPATPREAFLCALVDNTAQRELSDRLDMAVRAGGIGVWDYDVATRRARWNDIMRAHFGVPASEVSLEDWFARVHPEDVRQARDDLARAMVQSGPYQSEYRVRRPDGSVRVLHSLGAVHRNAAGRPVRAFGVSYDVTAARSAESQQRARELAEQANQAKNDFLSRMSHELRTPLNAILGFAQLMQAGGEPLSIRHRAHIKQIESAGWHLVQLVNDLLDLSRIESGHIEVRLDPVDLAEAVTGATQLARSAVKAHPDVRIDVVGVPNVRVQADATRLKQVLVNLLSNAIKYNRADGSVVVSVILEPTWATVSIADAGPGIPPAQLEHIFEPFNRLSAAAGVEGTGLGLAIAHRLTLLMRGQLTVSSKPGEGSTFSVRLPLDSNGDSGVADPAEAADDPRLRVLYLEDNTANAELMREVFALRRDFRLHLAATIEEAMQLADTEHFDLLLLDLNLAGERGFDFINRIHERTGEIPHWIAVTADVMPATERAVDLAGAMGIWRKPIDVNSVLGELDALATRSL